MALLCKSFGHEGRAAPGLERAFTQSTANIASALLRVFVTVGGPPPDPSASSEECAAFALSYCSLVVRAAGPAGDDTLNARSDHLVRSAVGALVQRGSIRDPAALVSRLRARFQSYVFEVQHEILGEGAAKHGGPMFAFAIIFANAYGIDPMDAPLLALSPHACELMSVLFDAVEALRGEA